MHGVLLVDPFWSIWKLFRETPGSISITSSFLDIVILAPIITIIVTVSPMQVWGESPGRWRAWLMLGGGWGGTTATGTFASGAGRRGFWLSWQSRWMQEGGQMYELTMNEQILSHAKVLFMQRFPPKWWGGWSTVDHGHGQSGGREAYDGHRWRISQMWMPSWQRGKSG